MIYIYYINLINIDFDKINKLIEKLIYIGYKGTKLNNISFCPYLIIHKDFENTDYIFENINEGYLNLLKNNKLVIIKELNNIEVFISKSIEIKNNNLNNLNKLF